MDEEYLVRWRAARDAHAWIVALCKRHDIVLTLTQAGSPAHMAIEERWAIARAIPITTDDLREMLQHPDIRIELSITDDFQQVARGFVRDGGWVVYELA